MTVIARDTVAADHLVYAWPFPLGPECEVSCREDEQVVMCPSWVVGDRLGPGRHRWRTPDPMRPVAAFFVLTAPVEVSFDMMTMFLLPQSGHSVRLRAAGAVQIRCADPSLLIAQFVGLPFDHVNDGILRSVSRSVERMLSRLLTRRTVLVGTPYAVTDPAMLGQIIEELIAYNPTAGAVFGVELVRVSRLAIGADDGSSPYAPPLVTPDWAGQSLQAPQAAQPAHVPANGEHAARPPAYNDISLLETARGRAPSQHDSSDVVSSGTSSVASGEISSGRRPRSTEVGMPPPPLAALGTPPPGMGTPSSLPGLPGVEVPRAPDEITEPGVKTPLPGALAPALPMTPPPIPATPAPGAAKPPPIPTTPAPGAAKPPPIPGTPAPGAAPPPIPAPGARPGGESRGAIVGIGMAPIGSHVVAGEIPTKVAPGQRVLVPGPHGLMQSATVRQLVQGYYELEVGSSGETIWVPISGVVPDP